MANYLIPNYRMIDLEKKIRYIRNKGANIIFNVINDNIPVPAPELGDNFIIECSEVEVEGEYKINGWEFVGTIEHGNFRNIIRLADTSFENRIPDRYWTAPAECEHCHINRARGDTFLVYNESRDEFKQVGRTCLKQYTQGLDAAVCASLSSVMVEIDRLNMQVLDGNFDTEFQGVSLASYAKYPMSAARRQAYTYVKNNGYIPRETGPQFARALTVAGESPSMCTEAEAEAVQTWLENSPEGSWRNNVLAAWTKNDYESRDASLITSAVSVYLKAKEREEVKRRTQASIDNSFAGQVGEKITLTIAQVRVAYWRNSGYSYYHNNQYPVYRIVGTDNKIYLWGCSSGLELHPGEVLQGTIKRLNERPNGEKQTELTRCKVISTAKSSSETEKSNSETPRTYRGFNFSSINDKSLDDQDDPFNVGK